MSGEYLQRGFKDLSINRTRFITGEMYQTRKNRLQRFYSTSPVEWTPERRDRVLALKVGTGLFRKRVEMIDDFSSHLLRFAISLDAYLDSSDVMDPDEIIDLASSPEGNDELELIRRRSFLAYLRSTPLESSPELEGRYFSIRSIGDIFNYNYSINWKVEKNDLEYYRIPVNQDTDVLHDFRMTLRRMLTPISSLEEVDWGQLLIRPSSSRSDFEGISDYLFAHKQKRRLNFKPNIGSGRRVQVQESPCSLRDTVVLDLESLLSVQLIDRQVDRLLQDNFLSYIGGDDREAFMRRLYGIYKKSSYFFCRDIKKEGLTKPRNLLRIMLEELKMKFPHLKAFEHPGFYDDFHLIVDGYAFETERGHGLGMANSLTTLMQIIITNMNPYLRGSSVCCNDDIVIYGNGTLSDSDNMVDEDVRILNGLGLIYNKKKSFLSRFGFVFCEEYIARPLFNYKDAYERRAALLPLTAVNVVHAKQISASITKEFPEYIDEILRFWGYEFASYERELPSSLGGWGCYSIFGYTIVEKQIFAAYKDFLPILAAALKKPPLYKTDTVFFDILRNYGIDTRFMRCYGRIEYDLFISHLSDKMHVEFYENWRRIRARAYSENRTQKALPTDILYFLKDEKTISEWGELTYIKEGESFSDIFLRYRVSDLFDQKTCAYPALLKAQRPELVPFRTRKKPNIIGFDLDDWTSREISRIISRSYFSPELEMLQHIPEWYIKASLVFNFLRGKVSNLIYLPIRQEHIEDKLAFFPGLMNLRFDYTKDVIIRQCLARHQRLDYEDDVLNLIERFIEHKDIILEEIENEIRPPGLAPDEAGFILSELGHIEFQIDEPPEWSDEEERSVLTEEQSFSEEQQYSPRRNGEECGESSGSFELQSERFSIESWGDADYS